MDYIATATIEVLAWLIIVGGSLSAFAASTRHAIRQARKQWSLPPKIWVFLNVGLILQAIGILSLALALLTWFLSLQLPNDVLISVLLIMGSIGLEVGSVILVAWLGAALLLRSRSYANDGPVSHLSVRMLLALPFAGVVVGAQGVMIGFLLHSWLIGLAVSFPVAAYVACLAALLTYAA